MNIYEQNLPKTAANYAALTPVDFLLRAAEAVSYTHLTLPTILRV